jgi:hypothetical protein
MPPAGYSFFPFSQGALGRGMAGDRTPLMPSAGLRPSPPFTSLRTISGHAAPEGALTELRRTLFFNP